MTTLNGDGVGTTSSKFESAFRAQFANLHPSGHLRFSLVDVVQIHQEHGQPSGN
jgi:hypothetical protein